jgi:hypothetical protein
VPALAIPKSGLDHETVRNAIRNLVAALEAIKGGSAGTSQSDLRRQYVQWTEGAEPQLRSLFRTPHIWTDLYSDGFDRILHNPGLADTRLIPAILLEVERQLDRLRHLDASLAADRDRLQPIGGARVVLVDTNALVHGQLLPEVNWLKLVGTSSVKVIVPLVVIDELDELSYRSTETGPKARQALKHLQELRKDRPPDDPVPMKPGEKGATIQLLVDRPGHVRRGNRDLEFLDHADYVSAVTDTKLVVVTTDYGMRLRAVARDHDWRELPRRTDLGSTVPTDP